MPCIIQLENPSQSYSENHDVRQRNTYIHYILLAYSKSKSSNFSLYCKILLLILLLSTQVTKSSIPLVTNNAVSVIVSVPTLTCPCSISFVAVCTVSLIRSRVMTTGNRRLQKADTVTFFSTSDSFEVLAADGRMPMSYSLERRSSSCLWRNVLSGGSAASL